MELPYYYALSMGGAKHLAASVLLAAGIVLVFGGLRYGVLIEGASTAHVGVA